ncbi:oxidoreductase [Lasiosphaeria ovina]|uniref:Oxidoreductase n=1 Tax=Lasiosphaeria ovina TaxID=92902 RepID=A0AAE0JUH4_9PEZI|nr:oxidoreductase [Lasiosphaeria ovina]
MAVAGHKIPRRVEQHGRKCYLFPTDTTGRENCRKVVDEAVEVFGGHIDILFNNAAFQTMVEDIKNLGEDQWLHTFNTNIHPIFYLSKYALKRGSVIINNASINAYTGRPDLLDYTSTKGTIVGKGILVNAVAPEPVWTPLIPATMTNDAQKYEIATCVVFLAAADSSCISGQTIHCNGGTIVSG